MAVLGPDLNNSPHGLCGRKATLSSNHCPGLPVPNSLYDLCGRKATFEEEEEAEEEEENCQHRHDLDVSLSVRGKLSGRTMSVYRLQLLLRQESRCWESNRRRPLATVRRFVGQLLLRWRLCSKG